MTVQQLIDTLAQYPPHLPVCLQVDPGLPGPIWQGGDDPVPATLVDMAKDSANQNIVVIFD